MKTFEKTPDFTQPEIAGDKTSTAGVPTNRGIVRLPPLGFPGIAAKLRDISAEINAHDEDTAAELDYMAHQIDVLSESQDAELKQSRSILVESVLAIGGHAEERTSLDFLAHLPEEIKLRYKRHLDMVRAIYTAAKAGEVLCAPSFSPEKSPDE